VRATTHCSSSAGGIRGTAVRKRRKVREEMVRPMQRSTRERREAGALEPTLSRREWQILDELSRGATNAEIAASLEVSVNTVKTYVKLILLKLDARNRTAAGAWFERHRNSAKLPSEEGITSSAGPPRSPPPTRP
jgi:DNA-binding NarL/FixJ family response regulator